MHKVFVVSHLTRVVYLYNNIHTQENLRSCLGHQSKDKKKINHKSNGLKKMLKYRYLRPKGTKYFKQFISLIF